MNRERNKPLSAIFSVDSASQKVERRFRTAINRCWDGKNVGDTSCHAGYRDEFTRLSFEEERVELLEEINGPTLLTLRCSTRPSVSTSVIFRQSVPMPALAIATSRPPEISAIVLATATASVVEAASCLTRCRLERSVASC